MFEAVVFVVFPLCMAYAALTDLFEMTIPNRVSLVLSLAFVAMAPFSGMPLAEFGWHLAAGLMVFAVCFSLFAINTMGGGDAKLLTAAALWYGFNGSLLTFVIAVTLLGGLVTIAVVIIRAWAQPLAATGLSLPFSLTSAKKIPYGIAIAMAGLATFAQSPLAVEAVRRLTTGG